MSRARLAFAFAACLVAGGCKTIPSDSYGIARLRFHGVDELDEAALRACLATREREAFQVDLGTSSELNCNVPPFDSGRLPVRLVTWPWTEWPTFDEAVFERDLDRVERWYRARGYYDARIERTRFSPEQAAHSDEIPAEGEAGCDRRDSVGHRDQGCRVEIDVYVHEGEPVHVRDVTVTGHETLSPSIRRSVRSAVALETGDRFDEAMHDETKLAMVTAMRESGYACAEVAGQVDLDPDQRIADVHYALRAGIPSRFREIRVEVTEDDEGIPLDVIRAVSAIEPGMTYAPSRIANAQRDVYALGAFSAVDVEAIPVREDGSEVESTRACTGQVDVIIRVTPGRRVRWGLGAGVDSGQPAPFAGASATGNTPQWNIHVVGRFEHRNFLGGLRRLVIEERPKITFQQPFPGVRGDAPTPGNELSLEFRQPAFIERATTLLLAQRWDLGPDPFYGLLRHTVDVGGSVERMFLRGRLSAALGVYGSVYRLVESNEGPTDDVSDDIPLHDYAITYLRQYLMVDYRDDPHVSHSGMMFAVDVNEGGVGPWSTWSYVRVIPEIRAFIPLPARITIAGRFLMGAMYIYDRPGGTFEAVSNHLGPSAYRLRGGGPNSHRGYTAGQLGDVDTNTTDAIEYQPRDGGLAKWEASLEIRTHITDSLGAVAFIDAGDVNRGRTYRFDVPHFAVGFGIRYYTIIGPLRLDFGFRPRAMQAFGSGVDNTPQTSIRRAGNVPGAISLTIGEAF